MGRHSKTSKQKYNKRHRQKKRRERAELRKKSKLLEQENIGSQTEESWCPSSVASSIKFRNVDAWVETTLPDNPPAITVNLTKFKLSKLQSKKVKKDIDNMQGSLNNDPLMKHFSDIQKLHMQYNKLIRVKNLSKDGY